MNLYFFRASEIKVIHVIYSKCIFHLVITKTSASNSSMKSQEFLAIKFVVIEISSYASVMHYENSKINSYFFIQNDKSNFKRTLTLYCLFFFS